MSTPLATSSTEVAAALDRAFRDERTSVLATLIRTVGDFTLAEDAVQDAFADAVAAWARDGIPRNVGAWLTVAARRRAIDRIRKDRSITARAARLAELTHDGQGDQDDMTPAGPIADDRLRLIFTCCHPALDRKGQMALTLRMLGGLTTGEIARAFLVSEPTMGKRIVRAKKKITEAGIPYRVPPAHELPARLNVVLRVIYLIFNEGYSASHGAHLVRRDLCTESIRLARLLTQLMPEEGETWGLLSLMLLHHARREARTDHEGRFMTLETQHRELWDQEMLSDGLAVLVQGLRLDSPGEYRLEAAIAAILVQPVAPANTQWRQIAELYRRIGELNRSPVVQLNRAAALGLGAGPAAGLALIAPLLDEPALVDYQPLHVTHAELLARADRPSEAVVAYRRALELTVNTVEHEELQRRLHALRQ